MNLEELKTRIKSFSELKKGWDGYDAETTTDQSIEVANSVLESISETTDVNTIFVYPMRDGGIQFEIGHYKEIQIFNNKVTELEFDDDYNVISQIPTNKFVGLQDT